jgi:hypothetical protein
MPDRQDHDAMMRQLQEIRDLDVTNPVEEIELMQGQWDYEQDCSGPTMGTLVTCRGESKLCGYHYQELMPHLAAELLLKVMGRTERLSTCDDCGKFIVECWKVRRHDA